MLKVGLSGNPIETKIRKHFDGIGVYTATIHKTLSEYKDIEVYPLAYTKHIESLEHSQQLSSSYMKSICENLLFNKAKELDLDVMHFTDYHVIKTSCPSVATVHDAIPLKYPEWVSNSNRTLKNYLIKKMVNQADHFIAVSHYAVSELVEYFKIPEERISVIHYGIDSSWLEEIALDNSIFQKYNIVKNYFLIVGTFQPRKNIERMIKAYFDLPEIIREEHPLLIVGKEGWKCGETVNLIYDYKSKYPKQIFWLNNVQSRADLRQIYAHAFCLLFATLYEGFGIPILEGFASNIPVITSNVASMPEVAENAAYLVDPLSQDQIANSMFDMVKNDELRIQYIHAGRKRLEMFKWEHQINKLLSLYTSLSK